MSLNTTPDLQLASAPMIVPDDTYRRCRDDFAGGYQPANFRGRGKIHGTARSTTRQFFFFYRKSPPSIKAGVKPATF